MLKNTIIAISIKYLNNFSKWLEIPLINRKFTLKIKRTNHFALSANDNDNDDPNSTNIIFATNDTKLYVPLVTLSGKDNRKLSKRLSKGFERSAYWNE